MLAAVSVALLLVAAPGQPREEVLYLPSPWLFGAVELAARAEALRTALVAEPVPPGPTLVDEASFVAADEALRRGEWRIAAERFERSGHPAPVAARFNALLIHVGLGTRHPDELLEEIGEARADAAALFWDARLLLADDDARLQHARVYLRRFVRVAGPDLRVLAEFEVARILWDQSCGVPAIDGTCGVRARVDWSFGCYDVQREALLMVEREPSLADEARRLLTAALRRAERIDRASLPPARARALRDATSSARWLLAESTFEALLRVRQPSGLRLEVEEWRVTSTSPYSRGVLAEQRAWRAASIRRYRQFYDDKHALFRQLERHYAEILADASPTTAFAALLRSSQAVQDVALQLSRGDKHPHDDGSYAFCHEHSPVTTLREAAQERLELCASLAVETGHVDAWAMRCQQILEDLDPARFSPADEISPPFARAEPRAFTAVLEPPESP